MGSFNINCFVSKQTIKVDDEVVIFPVKMMTKSYNKVEGTLTYKSRQHTENGWETVDTTCNHTLYTSDINGCRDMTGFLKVAGPMLTATYDDYGCFKIHNTPQNIKALQVFFIYLYDSLYDVNIEDKVSIKFKEWCHDYGMKTYDALVQIWNKLYEGILEEITFLYKGNVQYKLDISVMSGHAYDYLLNQTMGKDINYKKYFYMLSEERYNDIDFNDAKVHNNYFLLEFLQLYYISFAHDIIHTYDIWRERKNVKEYIESDSFNKETFLDMIYEKVESAYKFSYVLLHLQYLFVRLEPLMYVRQDYNNAYGNSFSKLVNYVNNKVNEDIAKNYE